MNNTFSGILCFYRNILHWDETTFKIPPRPRIKKIPNVLSEEEVKRLFDVTKNMKHRVLLKTAYSAGLRLSEVIRLRPEHIESDPSRMMIRIEQSKGRKDRYTILSRTLLPELREYWHRYQPREWLFPGRGGKNHIGPTTAHQIFVKAKKSRDHQGPGDTYPRHCACYAELGITGTFLQPICSTMGRISTPSNASLALRP